jgi:hypothetical protein
VLQFFSILYGDGEIQAAQKILLPVKYGRCDTTGPMDALNVMFFGVNCGKPLFFKAYARGSGAYNPFFDGAADYFRLLTPFYPI